MFDEGTVGSSFLAGIGKFLYSTLHPSYTHLIRSLLLDHTVQRHKSLCWNWCYRRLWYFVLLIRICSYSIRSSIVSWARGFGVCLRTLSRWSGIKPVAAQALVIFLFKNALSLAGPSRRVKCSLPTVFSPPRNSRSTSSRYAAFKGAKTPTSQGWSLWEVWDSRRHRRMLFSKQNSRISMSRVSQSRRILADVASRLSVV